MKEPSSLWSLGERLENLRSLVLLGLRISSTHYPLLTTNWFLPRGERLEDFDRPLACALVRTLVLRDVYAGNTRAGPT